MRILLILLKLFLYLLPFIILFLTVREIYYLIKIRLVNKLLYSREFSTIGVFEEDTVEIIETITNPLPVPLFNIDVETYIHSNLRLEGRDISDGMQLVISRFQIPPFTKLTRTYKVKCAHRGYYTMNTATVLTKSIFAESVKSFQFSAELYVYPKLFDSIGYLSPVNTVFGESFTRRPVVSDPFSVAGVRDYMHGDPFNSINFKATARSSVGGNVNIKVNKYDNCSDRIIMFYLDFTHDSEKVTQTEYENSMETALSLTASAVHMALENGYKVGYAANCRMIDGRQSLSMPIMSGKQHVSELLMEMSKVWLLPGCSFPALLDNGAEANLKEAEVYILTTHMDENTDEAIGKLKRYNTVKVVEL